MASKALLLFARAARSAAAATYRVACLAERRALSPEAKAAASDGPRFSGGRSAAAVPTHVTAAPPAAMAAPSPRTGGWVASVPSSKDLSETGDSVVFLPKEEDLESDEALWGLYERWCKALNQKRDNDEMVRRFNKFKEVALRVHNVNNAKKSLKLKLSKFADGKLAEKRVNHNPHEHRLAKKFSNSSILFKGDGKFLREVFADFHVVNGKLYVLFPSEKGKAFRYTKEISAEYEVTCGRLFADLPEGHELVVPNLEFIQSHW